MGAPAPRGFDPFLLPVCSCGGATVLASCQPTLVDETVEERTYRCSACGGEHIETARRRALLSAK